MDLSVEKGKSSLRLVDQNSNYGEQIIPRDEEKLTNPSSHLELSSREKETAKWVSDPTITSPELRSLPSPTTSFPLDTNGGYYSTNSTDSRRDSRDSQASSGVSNSCGGKLRPKREGKDEKLAREKGITKYISVHDIINIPNEELLEELEKFKARRGMTEEQFTIAKDIRRRGKNKNAAQNCRKRANDRLSDLTAITYIENEDLKNNYEKLKKDKQEKGELYEEIHLFHGTDEENIDEIFIKNFDINRHPLRRKKKMAHGRGIYMCDRPGPCYKYGKILILSRVLCSSTAGDTQMVSRARGTGSDTGTIYVIKKVENILPYCVINKHQTLGNGASTSNQTLLSSFKFQHSSNQTLIRPAHLSSPFQSLHQQLHAVFGSTNMAIPFPAMSGIINSTSPGNNTGS